jgi:hypothetical protein
MPPRRSRFAIRVLKECHPDEIHYSPASQMQPTRRRASATPAHAPAATAVFGLARLDGCHFKFQRGRSRGLGPDRGPSHQANQDAKSGAGRWPARPARDVHDHLIWLRATTTVADG